MQQEIYSVAATETYEFLYGWSGVECEVCCCDIVDDEWYDISDGIRDINLYEQLQEEIYGIVDAGGETAVQDKTYKLRFAGITMEYGVNGFQLLIKNFELLIIYIPGCDIVDTLVPSRR